MILSTKSRFLAAIAFTGIGIALLAAYAWRSFGDVSAELENLRTHLERVEAIEHIEEDLHELGAKSERASEHSLDAHIRAMRDRAQTERDVKLVAMLEERIALARSTGTSEAWSEAAEVMSQLVKGELTRMSTTLKNTEDPAKAGARVALRLGGLTVLVFGVLSLFAYLRYRRDAAETRDRLRRADRLSALGTMAASVAHEINNPLATISGCASAVKDRLLRNETSHEDSIEYLGMIDSETTRCSGIVRQLRDLSRDAPPAMAPTNLTVLAEEVATFVGFNRAGPKVKIAVAAAPAVTAVCDPDKLKQLLLNLLVNARDAAGEGGVVDVAVEQAADGAVRLTVADNGVGMSPDELARVFEPFHTTKTRGLGLGLFLCERIAMMHGGSIHAESEGRGRGARFVVDLPARLGVAL